MVCGGNNFKIYNINSYVASIISTGVGSGVLACKFNKND